jgi:hypothetical protein
MNKRVQKRWLELGVETMVGSGQIGNRLHDLILELLSRENLTRLVAAKHGGCLFHQVFFSQSRHKVELRAQRRLLWVVLHFWSLCWECLRF